VKSAVRKLSLKRPGKLNWLLSTAVERKYGRFVLPNGKDQDRRRKRRRSKGENSIKGQRRCAKSRIRGKENKDTYLTFQRRKGRHSSAFFRWTHHDYVLPETMRPDVSYERKDFYRKSSMLLICTTYFCSTETARSQEIAGHIENLLVKRKSKWSITTKAQTCV
jgi:hypothetical protein